MKKRHLLYAVPLLLVALLALGWVARARLAGEIARRYFAQHGIESSLEIGALDFSGLSGRFALGPAANPDLAADHIQLIFDPLRLKPRVIEVRLIHPVIRARMAPSGRITLGSLQAWIDDLQSQPGQSDYVSDNLAVALNALELYLATPGGALRVNGDVRLVKNVPVIAALRLSPARLAYNGIRAEVTAARLTYDRAKATLAAQIAASVQAPSVTAQQASITLNASGVQWSGAPLGAGATTLHLHAAADALNAGLPIDHPVIEMTAHAVSFQNGRLRADAAIIAQGGIAPALDAVRAADPALAAALARNLKHWTLNFAGHGEAQADDGKFILSAPLVLTGAGQGVLRLPALDVSWMKADGVPLGVVAKTLSAKLNGPGLPTLALAVRDMGWTDGTSAGTATLAAQFSFGPLKQVDLQASGTFGGIKGLYWFKPATCAHLTLAAFHPGASDLANQIKADLCAPVQDSGRMLQADASGWRLNAEARDASANLPLVNAHLAQAGAQLSFQGKGAPQSGTATINAAALNDLTPTPRFKPITATGTATLANEAWTGTLAIAAPKQAALAHVSFHYALATATGQAHIEAPSLSFTPGVFQPADILPLLAPLKQAKGTAAFTGDVGWSADTLTSSGKLSLAGLDFLTPLGPAHTVKTELALTSLLPPATAPGQHIAISRIDWTLPLSAINLVLGFTPASLSLESADTGIAQGRASLDPIAINLADPTHLSGTVRLNSIALQDLIAASNLADKLKLTGKISGTVPFTLTPDGLRIANGHVTADGPGRLEVNRSLWNQGSVAANAVQDFAYQALEHLAFDQLSADLNSVAGGRLQVVFHVKGHSDPPQAQKAEVAVTDLINGTALQKPIPLPSNTPIDLTLDTSLNFDELLKSYSEAWSKALIGTGAPQ